MEFGGQQHRQRGGAGARFRPEGGGELGSEFLEVVRSQSPLGPCRMGEDFGLWGAVQRF